MDRLPIPKWAPYVGLVAVVAVLIAFSVATRGDSKEPASAVPANQPLAAEGLSDASAAKGVVLRLWQLVQQGNYPLAVLLYHPRVVNTFGAEQLMGALGLQRQTALQNRPVIKNIERSRLGTAVTVQTEDSKRPLLYSFNLVKRKARWAIVFDSLLGDALPAYVQQLSPKNKGAGEKAVSRYRGLFLPREVRKRPISTTRPRPRAVQPRPREVPSVRPVVPPQAPTPPAITTPRSGPPAAGTQP